MSLWFAVEHSVHSVLFNPNVEVANCNCVKRKVTSGTVGKWRDGRELMQQLKNLSRQVGE